MGWGWFGEGRILYYGVGAGKGRGLFRLPLGVDEKAA